jgi:hypothetical protein
MTLPCDAGSRLARGCETRVVTTTPPPPPAHQRIWRWILGNPIPAVTIGGAVVYVIVRRALSRFYDAFGVELEEVGLGYADVLARAALGVVVVFVAYFMVFGLVLLLAAREFVRRVSRIPRQAPLAILVGAMLTYFIASVVFLGYTARLLAEDVVAGESVRPGTVPSVQALRNPFALRVEPVQVRWLSERRAPAELACDCRLMYLGRSGGIYVLYDADHRRTLRVPESEVLLVRSRPG